MNSSLRFASLSLAFALSASPALAAEVRISVGDVLNGQKLYARECAACHGDDGRGGKVGRSMTDSGRMNLLADPQLHALIREGKGLKTQSEHRFPGLSFLDTWDVIAHLRSLHLGLADFFPQASRYVSKSYTIDQYGLERIEKATGKKLDDATAPVFTFFTFPGEEGRLRFIAPDPIQIDQLKKDKKSGYLVFVPFTTDGFSGELGIAMDKEGKMLRILVHPSVKGSEALNKNLARFEGSGKKGQKDPFKVAGGKAVEKLGADLWPVYLRAMETVTMYDREENERTWADE